MLILAFDTATERATSALVDDGEVLGERVSRASTLLADVDALLRQAGAHPRDIDALAVGTGPGSFTGIRIGLAVARGLGARARRDRRRRLDAGRAGRGCAGGHSGDRRASGARCSCPARVRSLPPSSRSSPARSASATAPCATASSSSRRARRCPPDDDERHLPRARFHAELARDFGPVELVEPLYVACPGRGRGGAGERRAPQARAARPGRDREDRARVVSDSLVALDVRRRARQAELALARGVRAGGRRARRLPRHLPLRRRVARDEPRRHARRTAAAGSRGRCSTGSSR